jgi:hypothetical protein
MSGGTGTLTGMDPVVTGGLIGEGGTLLGAGVQDALASLRERRRDRRLRRRAVTAIVGELVATVSILDKSLTRQAWWPEGDEPRRDEWERHRDVLAEELDTETVMRIGIVYDSIRSLAATRSSPLMPVSKGPLAGCSDTTLRAAHFSALSGLLIVGRGPLRRCWSLGAPRGFQVRSSRSPASGANTSGVSTATMRFGDIASLLRSPGSGPVLVPFDTTKPARPPPMALPSSWTFGPRTLSPI